MSSYAHAVPQGERPTTHTLTIRAGCHGGTYRAWMEALGLESPEAVREAVDAAGIDPMLDTASRASDCKYNRPEEHDAYLTLRQEDARTLLDQHG